jgi:Immunity protein 26
MPKITPAPGDVFLIPLSESESALCRVVYVSSYFKKVMLITVHGRCRSTQANPAQALSGTVASFYCSTQSMATGHWPLVGSSRLQPEDKLLSRRIVGGDVWLADQHLGPASEEDSNLPQMDVHGDKVLVRKLAALSEA